MAPRDDVTRKRTIRQDDLAGGVNTSAAVTKLAPEETPDALNIDWDSQSVHTTNGSIKFNNQVAPGSAVRMRCDPALSPLMVLPTALGGTTAAQTCDVPLRGYGYLPYSTDTDIGGRFDSEGDFFAGSEVFHIRRGRSFELDVSFEIPPEEKLYESPTKGVNAPVTPTTWNPPNGFDEALDECFCIIQKGGDRTAPMSWALAVVNIGNGVGLGGAGALWPHIPARRPSNYCLAFIWYDAPGWGECSISTMKYNLTTGQDPVAGAASQFSTQAYRAVLIHKYVEPGRRYSVAVQLKMDTGSPGATTVPANTAWNADGYFKVWVSEEGEAATSYTYTDGGVPATSGLDVCRGPADSLSYLCRYGVRYAGRDAVFVGLGMRFAPWMRCGFIPFGADAAPLRAGGFQMLDRTTASTVDLYGGGMYTLTFTHVAGNAYMAIPQQGVSTGDVNFGSDPKGRQTGTGPTTFFEWDGLKNYPNCNTNALRGYRVVATTAADTWVAASLGAVITLLDYVESGGAPLYRLNFLDGADGTKFPNFGPARGLLQCFRWHQRELIIGQVRIFGSPRAYDDADGLTASRRLLSLHSSLRLDDATEPDIANLIAYYPMDDSEGATLREKVVGGYRNGFLCPFGNATTDGGARGKQMVFLSGEGEALTRDLSDDPIFKRELQRMLAGSSQGFGFELTMVPTEAFQAIGVQEALPDSGGLNGSRPAMVPDLLCWDIKDATTVGTRTIPRPLLVVGHRTLLASVDPNPFRSAAGLGVAVAVKSDQEDVDEITPQDLMPWYRDSAAASHARYDRTAPWVGRLVTVQVGIQRTTTADQYDVYVALSPKDAFLPANGDPSDAEFAYWTDGAVGGSGTPYEQNTYYTAAHLTISRKDLARSVLTVGGRWNCKGKPGDTTNLGYPELNARMLADEVRWFGASPSGSLPTASGGIVTDRNGKLEGTNCLPPRELEADDILQPLGEGVRAVNVTQGSTSIAPPSATGLFTGEPAASQRAVKGLYLFVSGDEVAIPKQETFGLTKPEWYGIASVATNGTSATLRSGYVDPSRNGAVAGVSRLMGYSTFADDVRDRPLLLGKGKAYAASGITVADVILTDTLWTDTSAIGGGWKLRIYSPLGRSSSSEILPQWTRGLVTERRGPDDGILGLYGFNEKVYAAVRGAIFEADDRWRPVDFTDAVQFGVDFRSQKLPAGITAPLAQDMIVGGASEAFFPTFDGTFVLVMDARGQVDSFSEYQTILWLGDPVSDPSLFAGSASAAHRMQYSLRLNNGKPELVIASSAFYTGTTRPEKGLFVATAQQAVAVGEPFQIRFYLWTQASGTILCKPFCKINGKHVSVLVNAVDNNAAIVNADQWLMRSSIVTFTGGGGAFPKVNARVLVGVGRDSYRAPNSDLTFAASTIQGTMKAPQRLQGYLHSFNGILSDLAIARVAPWSGILSSGAGTPPPPDFDPFQISYQGPGNYLHLRLLGNPFGVGHKTFDSGSATAFVIRSSPFVSVYHELGMSSKNASWAENGSQLYVSNGGRPAVIIDGVGMQAGVPAPSVAPTFTIERFPLWKKNVRGTGTDDSYDPIQQAATAAAKQVYHYNSVGNTYLRSSLDATNAGLMSWVKDGYFHLKGYVRPRSVAGRIQLWRRADGSQSGGPFLDIVDGKVRFGWYDIDLKTEVWVESTGPVFQPGDVHYVNVRKRWPIDDALEVNWQNSYFTDGRVRRMTLNTGVGITGAGQIIASGAKRGLVTKFVSGGTTIEYVALVGAFAAADVLTAGPTVATNPVRPMNDVLQVRRFKRNGEAEFTTQAVPGAFRNLVSLTTGTLALPAGTNATGLVSAPGAIYSGAAAGVVNTSATAPAMGNLFHADMVGMYWEWGTGATDASGSVAGKKYRITAVNSATQIVVQDEELGTNPNFASTTDKPGGVFTGIELARSTSFVSSRTPDNSQAVIEMMGSSIQGQSTSGYAPFDGELYSFGFGVTTPAASGTNAQAFETIDTSIGGAAANDPISTGTDAFGAQNYDGAGGQPGALHYDDTRQVYCTDGTNYGVAFGGDTSQPSTTLVVESDPHAPSVAPTCTGTAAIDPFFTYIQTPDQWSAQRQVAVAIFDKTQNIVGDPSPQVTVKADAEDSTNPSGAIRIRLTNLPVARQPSEIWIFESVGDGSSGALFRVAKVENGTAEAAIQFDDEATALSGVVLEFTNAQPPRCDIVEASGIRMVYGALEEQPDAFVASKPAFPGQVDFSKLSRLNSGFGTTITGTKDLDGFLLVLKRRAWAAYTFDVNNNPLLAASAGGVGCVAHSTIQARDGAVIFLADKGLCVLTRAGITNLAQPQWISTKLRSYFTDQTDSRRYSRAVACLNQRRQQYVLAVALVDEPHQFARVSLDMTTDGEPRFALYQHPNITALASVGTREGGVERLVGGTEEGFVAWLDDPRAQQALIGPDPILWGYTRFDAGNVATTAGVSISPSLVLDFELEGLRGTLLRWTDAGGVDRETWVLGNDASYLHFQSLEDSAPATSQAFSVATPGYRWDSGWRDMGNHEIEKVLEDVTFDLQPGASGTVRVDLFRDLDDETVVASQDLDLDAGQDRFIVGDVDGHHFKVVVSSLQLGTNFSFEIASVVWRVRDTDQQQD